MRNTGLDFTETRKRRSVNLTIFRTSSRVIVAAIFLSLAVSGEVNRMIAAAINSDPKWFWERPEA